MSWIAIIVAFAAKFTSTFTILVKDGGYTRGPECFSSIDYTVRNLWVDSRPVGLNPKLSDSALRLPAITT